MVGHIALAASAGVGALLGLAVADRYSLSAWRPPLASPGGGPGPNCATCAGTGKVACPCCARWSDGDVGCRACAGSGRTACRSCRGSGTGRRAAVRLAAVRGGQRTSVAPVMKAK